MTRAACASILAMLATWYAAACGVMGATWLRWAVLAFALPTTALAYVVTRRRARAGAVMAPLGFLVAYGLVIGLFSPSTSLALAKCAAFGATTFAAVLGGTLLVEHYGRDAVLGAWRWIWRAFLVLLVVGMASGRWSTMQEGLKGPTGNPNMLGALLATIGTVLLVPPRDGERRGAMFYVEVVVGGGLLLLTRCRSAMLGLGVSVIVLLLSGRGANRWFWASAVALLAGAALVVSPSQTLQGVEAIVRKAPDAKGGDTPSIFANRLPVWSESWDAMVAGLPFGFGWGVKERGVMEWSLDYKTSGYGREEGTSWLPVGEELGLPGMALVAWLWVAVFRAVGRQPRRVRDGGRAAVLVLFVIAFFEAWFLTPGNWESIAFWTCVGVFLARPARVPHEALAPEAPPSGLTPAFATAR